MAQSTTDKYEKYIKNIISGYKMGKRLYGSYRGYKKRFSGMSGTISRAPYGGANPATNRRMIANLHRRVNNMTGELHRHHFSNPTPGTAVAIPAPSETPVAIDLSEIAQGDTAATRTGDYITPLYLNFRVLLIGNTSSHNHVRFTLVRTRGLTTKPTYAQVFQSTATPLGPLKVDRAIKFRVIWDETFSCDISHINQFVFKKYIPLKGKIKYAGSSGTAYADGNLFLFVFGKETTGSGNNATMEYNGVLGFRDH